MYFLSLARVRNNALEAFNEQKRNSGLFFGFIFSIGLLYFLSNKEGFFNYYIIGHFLSQEKFIRARECGVTSLYSNLLFYPKSIINDHMGIVVSKLLVLSFLVGISCRKNFINRASNNLFSSTSLFFILISILIPLVILTLDLSKSPVVGGIVVVPLLLSITWSISYIHFRLYVRKYMRWMLMITYVAVFGFGFANLVEFFSKHTSEVHKRELFTLNEIYRDIYQYSLQKSWNKIIVAQTFIRDSMGPHVFKVFYYEKYNKLLSEIYSETLGNSLYVTNEKDALLSLARSNVFIETLSKLPASPYPFESSVSDFIPVLDKYARKNFVKLNDYRFKGETFRVYVRT